MTIHVSYLIGIRIYGLDDGVFKDALSNTGNILNEIKVNVRVDEDMMLANINALSQPSLWRH
jgi:hypothetical protein